MKHLFHIVNAILLTVGTAWGVSRWRDLPERIPVHFGFTGQPDRWSGKGWELAILILLPLFMTAFLYGLAWLTRHRPRLLPPPDKDRLLALPPERQAPFWDAQLAFMAALAGCCALGFYALLFEMGEVAHGRQTGLSWVSPVAWAPLAGCIVWGLARLRAVRQRCLG